MGKNKPDVKILPDVKKKPDTKSKNEVKNKADTKKSSINPSYEKTPSYTKSLASLVDSATPKVNDFKEDYKKPESNVKVCFYKNFKFFFIDLPLLLSFHRSSFIHSLF